MSEAKSISDAIHEAIEKDARNVYQISLASGVNSAALYRFMSGKRDLTLASADKLCKALGLELRQTKKGR